LTKTALRTLANSFGIRCRSPGRFDAVISLT
jgi:hypothetical protein